MIKKYALIVAKSVYLKEYQIFLAHLRVAREESGLTQREVAKRLGRSQSFVAKCEQGHNRVDVAQLVEFCRALEIPLVTFIQRYSKAINELPAADFRHTKDQIISGDQ